MIFERYSDSICTFFPGSYEAIGSFFSGIKEPYSNATNFRGWRRVWGEPGRTGGEPGENRGRPKEPGENRGHLGREPGAFGINLQRVPGEKGIFFETRDPTRDQNQRTGPPVKISRNHHMLSSPTLSIF